MENLLTLPLEIRCHMLNRLTLPEANTIAATSVQLKTELGLCLRELYISQDEIDQYQLDPNGSLSSINLDILRRYPRLVRSEYLIEVTSWEELELISLRRHLKQAAISLDDIPLPVTIPHYHANPIQSPIQLIGIFITTYHNSHDELDWSFTFSTADYSVSIGPDSFCLQSYGAINDFIADELQDLIQLLNQLRPLRSFTAPFPPIPLPSLESLVLYIDTPEALEWLSGLYLNLEADFPSMTRFGLNSENDTLVNYNILEDVDRQGQVMSNITRLDVPINPFDLLDLKRIFPNVQAPLLTNLPFGPEIQDVLDQVREDYTTFRIPFNPYLNFNLQEDPNNAWSKRPCI